jgi:hypothetical protein
VEAFYELLFDFLFQQALFLSEGDSIHNKKIKEYAYAPGQVYS